MSAHPVKHTHAAQAAPHCHPGAASHAVPAAQSTQLTVEGASCASCVSKIESALRNVPGVARAEMNFAQRTVTVEGSASVPQLVAAVANAGYEARTVADEAAPAGSPDDFPALPGFAATRATSAKKLCAEVS